MVLPFGIVAYLPGILGLKIPTPALFKYRLSFFCYPGSAVPAWDQVRKNASRGARYARHCYYPAAFVGCRPSIFLPAGSLGLGHRSDPGFTFVIADIFSNAAKLFFPSDRFPHAFSILYCQFIPQPGILSFAYALPGSG